MKIAYLITDPGIPLRGGKGASVHARAVASSLVGRGHEVQVLAAECGGVEPWDPRIPLHALADGNSVKRRWRRLRRTLASPQATASEPNQDPLPADFAEIRIKEMIQLELAGRAFQSASRRLRNSPVEILLERLSPFGMAGLLLSRRLRLPRVVEMNAPLTEESRRWRALAFEDIAGAAERAALRSSDGVIAVSPPLAARCRELGIPPERILLLSNGVDPEAFRPGPRDRALAVRLGLEGADVIGFSGSLKAWHGVDILIDAFARMGNGPAPRRLLVVGDGPERARLEALARRRGVADRVIFTGAVPHVRMPDYTRLMDVAAAPYRDGEKGYFSPLKVLEYMASGVPVAASPTGTLPHLIESGRHGRLVDPGSPELLAEALGDLLESPRLRREMGDAARREAAKHAWVDKARRMAEFFNTILEAR
jgi:glycosyltransferase involved in cell wall biosynthesis